MTTTQRPDLRSATVLSVSPTGVTTIRVCFDQNIGSVPTAGRFLIGTYRQAEVTANTATRSTPLCADVVWSATNVDVTQHTYLVAMAGAVDDLTLPTQNLDDSTPVIQQSACSAASSPPTCTQNGTTGRATPPDLTGVVANPGANTMSFIFDQNIGAADSGNVFSPPLAGCPPFTAKFFVDDINGAQTDSVVAATTQVTFAGNVVVVNFPAGAVGTSVRAGVRPCAVQALTTGADINQYLMTVARPGFGGVTTRPDLASASAGGTTGTFLYDEVIDNPGPCPGAGAAFCNGFTVTRSDGVTFTSTSAAVTPGTNRVTANFAQNLGLQNEYLVWAGAGRNAVSAGGGVRLATASGVPIGGNAGAFALGFTTGAEVLRATFDNATSTVRLTLDQRVFAATNNRFRLVSDTGNVLPFDPINVSGTGAAAPEQTVLILQYNAGEVAGARSIQLLYAATQTFGAGPPYNSLEQALSPTATSAVLRKGSKVKFRKATGLKTVKQMRKLVRKFK